MQDVDAIIDAVPDLMSPQQLTQSLSNLVAWFPNHDPFELLQQNPQILENPNVEADPTYGKSWAESSLLVQCFVTVLGVLCVLVCCACTHHNGMDALRTCMRTTELTTDQASKNWFPLTHQHKLAQSCPKSVLRLRVGVLSWCCCLHGLCWDCLAWSVHHILHCCR